MIIAKCPLRISLVGGSTDLQEFVDTYGSGSVISFPCNLYTYITLFSDKNGYNKKEGEYIVNYSRRESSSDLGDIQNDIVREALKYFEYSPCTISFNTDVFSAGSGLASSSSYTVALVKALFRSVGVHMADNAEICQKALEIERRFNPLTGYQDTYGCGLGLFKRMDFIKTGESTRVTTKILSDELFNSYDCYLIYTGINRSSTKILNTLDLEKAQSLLPLVRETETAIKRERYKDVFKIINEGWSLKKETSKDIASNKDLIELDEKLTSLDSVLGHKLCGAGGGGYFLVFTEKDANISDSINNFEDISFKIIPDKNGVQVCNIAGRVSIL